VCFVLQYSIRRPVVLSYITLYYYTVTIHLPFDHNFGKFKPTCKTLSLTDSQENSLFRPNYCAALRQLRHIRRAIPTATFQVLVVALVHSRLDYGNAVVLVGIPAYLVRRLQSVLNAAARLIYHLRPHH